MSVELLLGDCLDILPTIEKESINMVWLDLPYCGVNNCKKESAVYCEWNEPIDLKQLWRELERITTYNAPLFFCCNAKFGAALINSNPDLFRYEYVWKKSKSVGFLNSGYMRLTQHELIYVFYKNKPNYYVKDYHTKIFKESKNKKINCEVYNTGSRDKKIVNLHPPNQRSSSIYSPPLPTSVIDKSIYGVSLEKDAEYKNTGGYDPPLPTSFLEIDSKGNSHPTQKPVELIEYFLKYFTKEGDMVLDPTFGSCSAGMACKNLGRNFIGIEMNEVYYDRGRENMGFVKINRIEEDEGVITDPHWSDKY